MQPNISVASLDFHYLTCPSRKLRRQIRNCFGILGISYIAIYGFNNFHRSDYVEPNVDSSTSSADKSQGVKVTTDTIQFTDLVVPDSTLEKSQQLVSKMKNDLISKNAEIQRLKAALEASQGKNEELQQLNETQRHLNDELIQRVAEFKSGAVYLNDKYGDFAYAFNLEGAEVVPLLRGINGGKLQLAALHSMSQHIPFGTVFDRPYRISSRFGARNIKNHPGASKNHKGIDFPVMTGTALYAPADGYAEVVRPSKSKKGSGNFIRLEHGFGFESSYSHLSKFTVKSGEFVQKGDLIGYSGNTGYTTGPHLHYEIKYRGRHIDPAPLFSYEPGTDISILRDTSSVDWDGLLSIYSDNALMSAVILRP
ncbi:peptidoglycan DD-metalloendopeptidase family protein [Vibrio sp. 10N.239.312.D08]|uniref:M23 family metallopeptidase n=1 Tax=Vibrio sp. 10N.239.312.D08 TaxID=3229978 RepID=UPI0035533CA5